MTAALSLWDGKRTWPGWGEIDAIDPKGTLTNLFQLPCQTHYDVLMSWAAWV